jgi:hypothetical protein
VHFTYQGFTHKGDRRCFTFRGIEEISTPVIFSIEIDLALLARNGVPVQEGPAFCLRMLTTACLAGPTFLERFHNYRVLESDFRSLLVERERRAAEKALRKPPRRPFVKPSFTADVHSGTTLKEH